MNRFSKLQGPKGPIWIIYSDLLHNTDQSEWAIKIAGTKYRDPAGIKGVASLNWVDLCHLTAVEDLAHTYVVHQPILDILGY